MMIFRNVAFLALVVTSTTLNYANADRTKLRGRWQVGDAKDPPVDGAAADVAGTPTDAGLRRRRRELKKDDSKKKDEKKGGGTSASSASTNIGAGNNAAKKQKNNAEKETAVISNMAGTGNNMPVISSFKPPKDEKDAKDAKDKKNDKKGGGGGGGGDKIKNNAKQKNDKNMETGMYAGTFNYAAVRPQAWNPSAVTLGSAQTSNINYASPGAATGNMVAGNAVSSAGVYKPQQQPAPVINNNAPGPVYNYAANTNQQQQQMSPVVVNTPPATNVIVQPANTPSTPGVTTGWSGLNRDNGNIAMTGMQCQSSNPAKFRCCNNEGSSACAAAGMGDCCDAFRNMCVNTAGLDATARGNLICKP